MSKKSSAQTSSSGKSSRAKAGTATHDPVENLRPSELRFEAFRALAERRSKGEMVVLPRQLTGHERRLHVRATLREDHRQRIQQPGANASVKFDKLSASLFSFFRGTCLLFYRDMAGEDAWMPTVLTLGDVHPENFGVMPTINDTPMFGVNDFDEAYYAPFTWDLKRGALGFFVAAKEEGVHKKKRRKIGHRFLRAYFKGIEKFAREHNEEQEQMRIDNAPRLIRRLLEASICERSKWLGKYTDDGRFRSSEKIVPMSSAREEFQAILRDYNRNGNEGRSRRAGELVVKDVAEKKGSGTASLGLARYFVLLEGPRGDGVDDLILEMKRARRSALAGLAPPSQYEKGGEAERVVNAQAVHLVGGDPFYGLATMDGESFLVRERSPFKNEIDISSLSKSEWYRYADACGHVLAHAHALSDESGAVEGDVEEKILRSAEPRDLLCSDILTFAEDALRRLKRDHRAFQQDHRARAFDRVDVVFD